MGCPGGSIGKESACSAGDAGRHEFIPRSGRSPERCHGNPLQYPYLEKTMDRGAWWAIVHRVSKSQAQLKWLSTICVYHQEHGESLFRKELSDLRLINCLCFMIWQNIIFLTVNNLDSLQVISSQSPTGNNSTFYISINQTLKNY